MNKLNYFVYKDETRQNGVTYIVVCQTTKQARQVLNCFATYKGVYGTWQKALDKAKSIANRYLDKSYNRYIYNYQVI